MPPQSILPRNSWFADSSLEQTGFEPLVPLKNGQAPRADRDGLSACPANSKTTVGLLVRIRFLPAVSQPNFGIALIAPLGSERHSQRWDRGFESGFLQGRVRRTSQPR